MNSPWPSPSLRRPRVRYLTLRDFRSYATLDLPIEGRCVVFVGENGVGKTNLLEAISLFAPGRGLRRAELGAMARHDGAGGFVVSAQVGDDDNIHRLGVGFDRETSDEPQRKLRVDGGPAPSAQAFSEHMRVIWLTPAMDGLFVGSASERRRFLDRLVLTIDPTHGARVGQFERALRGRNKLLEEGSRRDPRRSAWLDAIEHEAAELGAAIAAARAETVSRLADIVLRGRDGASPFAWPTIALHGEFDVAIRGLSSLEAEEFYRAGLAAGRGRDAAAGRTLMGPHTVDLLVRHGPKDVAAEECSTGEQKALLVSLVLAHAQLVGEMTGMAPITLLDELAAHFDPRRRRALFEILLEFGAQVLMTGADASAFADLGDRAQIYDITPGRVEALA